MIDRHRHDPHRDAGTSLIGTSIAVLVFVMFLATATHVLSAMYATSTVMAVSTDAARQVAARSVDDADLDRVQRQATRRAQADLGDFARNVHFTWETTPTTVRLHVVISQPWRLGPQWSPMQAFGHTDRTIVVRRERPR